MFMHTHEIQLIWHRHLHRNCELRTPNLLHCNCPWSFGATFQAFYIRSEWCCIIHLGLANSFIYLALTGYVTIELESQIRQVGTSGLTEKPLNRIMIRRSLWLRIWVWLEMVEQSSVARGNLNLLQSQFVDKINRKTDFVPSIYWFGLTALIRNSQLQTSVKIQCKVISMKCGLLHLLLEQ